MLKKIDIISLMNDMNELKVKKFNEYHLIKMMKKRENLIINMNFEKIRFLAFKSSKFRLIYHEVNIHLLYIDSSTFRRKLLLCENVSLTIQYWKMILNLTYVEIVVLHATLIDIERVKFVKRFNDSNDILTIFIIMHSVFVQNVNLNKCLNRVLIIINVMNAILECQDWR